MCYRLVFILSFIAINAFGQGENNVWILCNGIGLDFNTSPPEVFPVMQNGYSSFAVASDMRGNLLFSSNGAKVWDSNHNLMPDGIINNGAAISLIVPFVNDTNRFYLFTSSGFSNDTIYYSVINMTLNNGLGDIEPDFHRVAFLTGEHISAIASVEGDGCFLWVIMHTYGNNKFLAYKINESGIHPDAVISFSGFYNNMYSYMVCDISVGTDQKTLAISNGEDAAIEIHHFDNRTGIVSDAILVDSYLPFVGRAHAVCLSPDNSKLYVTGGDDGSDLIQYDLSQSPFMKTTLVSYQPGNGDSVYLNGHLRRAPDGKIYSSEWDGIYCINKPDLPASACDFSTECFTLSDEMSPTPYPMGKNIIRLGIQSNYVTDTLLCYNSKNNITAPAGYRSYLWSENQQTGQTITLEGNPALVWVKTADECEQRTDTFHLSYTHCNCNVLIPSAFSPNGDGVNDRFSVFAAPDIEGYAIKIFNRFGQIVFSSVHPDAGWDGTYKSLKCDVGTYYYIVNSKCNNVDNDYKGSITLLR